MGNFKRSLNRHFTVLELLIIIAIISLLTLIGAPRLSSVRSSIALQNARKRTLASLHYTKSFALSTDDTKQIDFSLESSNYVHRYTTHLGVVKKVEFSALEYTVSVDGGNTASVTFDEAGNAADHTIVITHASTAATAGITINSVGTIMVSQ